MRTTIAKDEVQEEQNFIKSLQTPWELTKLQQQPSNQTDVFVSQKWGQVPQ